MNKIIFVQNLWDKQYDSLWEQQIKHSKRQMETSLGTKGVACTVFSNGSLNSGELVCMDL